MSKILLIEDEAGIRRTLSVGLMQEGYDIEPCEDGLTGLSKVDSYSESGHRFDAVILDINLPDISGLKILRFLKEKHPNLPIIIITGYGDDTIKEEVESNKGDAYLEKPLDMNKLDGYLQNLIARKEEILGKEKEPGKTTVTSGYAFIRFACEDDFLPAYQKLYFNSGVVYCDAVRGSFDLILLMHGNNAAEIEASFSSVSKMRGIENASLSVVEKPILSHGLSKVVSEVDRFLMEKDSAGEPKAGINTCPCSSYALVEIEPGRFEDVFRRVYFMENVVACDAISGEFQMVLLVKAPTFAEIDGVITGSIAGIDGVSRVTQCNIINLLEI
jgi:CheY-like chemotaxis protein